LGRIDDFKVGTECWREIRNELVPKIEDHSLRPGDCKAFYKKWAKTPYTDTVYGSESEKSLHLLTRFKAALPKI